MRILVIACFVAFLLPGCASPKADLPNMGATGSLTATNSTVLNVVPAPVTQVLNLTEDGMLTTVAGGCVFLVPTCQFQGTGTDKSTFSLLGTGNITAISITVEWQAATPATDTLALSVSLQPCPDCTGDNTTFLGGTQGTSPLTLTLGPSGRLDASNQIHLFVYNQRGVVYNDQVPAYGYATADQAFHVTASATVIG